MSDAVLLLVERAGNRRQLARWVEEAPGLRLGEEHGPVDLVVLDGPGLARHRSRLEELRRSAEPAALPCLLVVPSRDAALVTPEVWRVVDDVVTTPIRPPELGVRVERLLARRRLSRSQAEHADELRRSNTDLERFAFVAAHELRSPLAVVAGFVETLGRRYRDVLEDGAGVLLDEALAGCRRMSALVEDVLAYSRVGGAVATAETDVHEVVSAALAELGAEVAESGARLEIGHLPTVKADPSLLRLVFRNLIANAIKFRRPGTTPTIEVNAERDERGWVFCVADDGIGIPEAESALIFEIFERGQARSEYGGSGIGLATSRRIVEELGGRIWSAPGERDGAVIRFTLPDRG